MLVNRLYSNGIFSWSLHMRAVTLFYRFYHYRFIAPRAFGHNMMYDIYTYVRLSGRSSRARVILSVNEVRHREKQLDANQFDLHLISVPCATNARKARKARLRINETCIIARRVGLPLILIIFVWLVKIKNLTKCVWMLVIWNVL